MLTFDKRVEKSIKAFQKDLAKNNLFARIVINFGNKKNIPFLSQVAYWVIVKQGGKLDLEFSDLKNTSLKNQNGNTIHS